MGPEVGLPPGFTLDKTSQNPQQGSGLPAGFTLDAIPGGAPSEQAGPTFENRAGQFGGGMNRGMAQTADLVLNAPSQALALAHGLATGGAETPAMLQAPNFAQRGMSAIGMNPSISLDDYVGGLLNRVGQFTGSMALPMGRLKSAAEYVKQLAGGTVAGTTATAAKEASKTFTDNPAIQEGAEVAGSLIPAGVSLAASAATKASMRGGATPAEVAANTAQLRTAGIEPSVGQATGNIAAQGAENILARTPFAGLPIVRRAQAQVDAIGKDLAEASRALSTVREKPAVGALVQRDIDSFVDRTQGKFVALDNDFKAMFPPEQRFAVSNTLGTLGKLSKVSPELPQFSAGLKDPNIRSWYERLNADTAGVPAKQVPTGVLGASGQPIMRATAAQPFQGVSMQTLIDVRSDIGANVNKSALLGQKPDAQYTALYSAISKDIEAAAKGTQAEAALARRDNYWSAFRNRVDNFLSHVAENPDKTRAYLDVLGEANVGREQILAVRRSVDPGTWKSVASAKLAQMAHDTQLGQFSLQKFVTEYKKLSDRPVGSAAISPADALFGGMGTLKRDLDTIVAASEKVLSGGRVYQNPSGTSTATVGMVAGAGLAGSVFEKLMTGDTAGAAIRLAEGGLIFGGARALANTLVNPKTVDWLATSTRIPAEKAAQYLQRLTPIIAEIPDPDQRKSMEAWRDDMRKNLTKPQASSAMQGVRG